MESRRRTIMAGALAAAGAALGALCPRVAEAAGIQRVGIFDSGPRGAGNSIAQDLVKEMASLGYVEGKNVEYLHRYPSGEWRPPHLAALADELVRARPDAIVTTGTALTRALARATATIPIVTNVGDPVRSGFARSIARPGGNVTGVALAVPETYEKMFDYLKAMIPGDWSIGMVERDADAFVHAVQDAARKRAIPVRTVSLKGMDAAQVDRVLASLRGQGVRVFTGRVFAGGYEDDHDIRFARKYGLVAVGGAAEHHVANGALMAYEPADADGPGRKAVQLVKILRGTPPGEIPFETPRKYRLTLNRKTARLLGLTIPREVLLVADRVYD